MGQHIHEPEDNLNSTSAELDKADVLYMRPETFRRRAERGEDFLKPIVIEGAFTRPHVDALSGTWVRCLSGLKLWIIVPALDESDWASFAREGQIGAQRARAA